MENSKHENAIKRFFRSTFRRHTMSEYSELLTRGLHGERGVNKKYPWAYVRFFALSFVLFAVFLLIVRFTSNELFSPTITVIASVCFNITCLIFLYELYPERDLSILAVFLAMLVGGAASHVVSQILFNLFVPANGWLKAVYSGFFEELPKAVATIAVVVISRKRSALCGFMFGAAVGCGFSVVEDMGYIFVQANEMPMMNLTTIIEISVSRGASAFFTHTLWTAAIGWAYCHFERHFANFVIYPVTLLSCGLHIAWDLPLPFVAAALVCTACALVACTECLIIFILERRQVFAEAQYVSDVEESNADENTLEKTDPEYWKHWGRFTVVLGAFLMAIIAVIYCSVPFRETYGTAVFNSSESFVEFMQDGKDLQPSINRPYDIHGEDVVVVEENGVVVKVTQREVKKEADYYYEYSASYDYVSGMYYYFPTTAYVKFVDELGLERTSFKEEVYNDGKLYASFFRVTDEVVTGYNFKMDGSITVFIYDADFVRDLNDPRYLWLFCTFAGIFGVSVVCYVSLKIKSWRVKKLCMTKDVSSAE